MTDPAAESSQEPKLSVAESLRRHWAWLLGVALFPLVAFLGTEIRVPSEVFTVLWLIVLTPWWDYSRCRKPFTLWIVAMGIWMASFCLTGLLMPFGSGTVG
jgi:hypothetical protein